MITQDKKQAYKELLNKHKALIKKVGKKSGRTNRAILFIYIIWILILLLCIIGPKFKHNGIIESGRFLFYLYIGLLAYFLFTFIHVLIHETGHLIFGLISGYRLQSFRIFSLTFVNIDGRIQRKKYSIKDAAGQCLMVPPRKNNDGSFPFILYNLGGGLANLIVSVPILLAAIFTENATAAVFFIAFCAPGIMLAAANLIPLDLGVQNDGMNIKAMIKHEFLRESFYLQLMVYAEMSRGKLITEYDPDIFALPDDPDVDKYTLAAFNYMYTYYRLLAEHEFEAAYGYLMKILEEPDRYPIATLNALQAEQLFFMVLHHRPVQEISVLYKRFRTVFHNAKTDIGIQRIHYIYEALLSEEEKKDIMTLIMNKKPKKWKACNLDKLRHDIEKIAASYPVAGEAAMHTDIMDYCSKPDNIWQYDSRITEQNDDVTTKQNNILNSGS